MASSTVFRGVDLGAFHSVTASAPSAEPHCVQVDVNDLANRSTPSVLRMLFYSIFDYSY